MSPVVALLRLVRFSPWWFAGCTFFAVLVFVLLPVPLGLATRAFFDALSGRADVTIPAAIAIIVGIGVLDLYSSPLLGNPWNGLQQKSHVLVRRNLFELVLRGFGGAGLALSVGDAISRFRDEQDSSGDALDALCDLIGRAIFAVVAAVLMWRVSPTVTIALFVPFLLTSVLTELLGSKIMAYRAASREATGRTNAFIGEVVGAQLAIAVAGTTSHVIDRLDEMGEHRRRVAVKDRVFGEMLDSINFHLVHVGTGIVLLFGAGAIGQGSFSIGDFALFVVFLDQLTYLPAEIGRLISDLKRMDVSLDRMGELVGDQPRSAIVAAAPVHLRGPVPELPPPPERDRLERLDVRGLTYTHTDGTPGIEDVSFVLERGSFTVVTGRIGAGKTTLLHAVIGLLTPQAGEVRWNGDVVAEPGVFFVPPRSAFTPQVPRLFSDTLRSNLLLGRASTDGELVAAVRSAVLESDVEGFEDGLDTVIGPRGVKLSGGQVQRAAAARMFVQGAELLVIDDLSSALDTETEAELWRRLFARDDETTCLVVSHRPAALGHADQVLHLEGGRLVERQVR